MTFGVGCILEDCGRDHHARGFCRKHYRQVVRRGQLWTQPGRNRYYHHEPRTCEYGDCTAPHTAFGYCHQHYDRWRLGRPMDGRPRPVEWDVARDYIDCGYSAEIIAERLHISEQHLFVLIRRNEPELRSRVGHTA